MHPADGPPTPAPGGSRASGRSQAAGHGVPGHAWQAIALDDTRHEHYTVLTFREADLRPPQRVHALESDFKMAVACLRRPRLIVDFSHVTAAPSAIMGLVLWLIAEARKKGVEVRLCCLSSDIRKAFTILNGQGDVEIFDSRHEALAAPPPQQKKRRWWWPFG